MSESKGWLAAVLRLDRLLSLVDDAAGSVKNAKRRVARARERADGRMMKSSGNEA